MRLPDQAHFARAWRVHELTRDFELEDVWELPTPGGAEDFPRLVEMLAAGDPAERSSGVVRLLWAVRWKLGGVLGWDDPDAGLGARVPSLRDRLPADLAATAAPEFDALPFRPLYLLGDEFAAEIANRTVHGVVHLGWVADGAGGFRGQMAVLVKPNGLLGRAYLAAIGPFRRSIVYPQLLSRIGRDWRAGDARSRGGA